MSLESSPPRPKPSTLTISNAGVIYFAEVLVAGALVGTLGVVAHVGTHSELLALILICETAQGHTTLVAHTFISWSFNKLIDTT